MNNMNNSNKITVQSLCTMLAIVVNCLNTRSKTLLTQECVEMKENSRNEKFEIEAHQNS